jgi:hypothetical protein
MSEVQKRNWIFEAEEIFEEIVDDPDNVNMKIPDEVAEAAGLVPGDTVKISVGDQGTMIIEKVTQKETNEQEEKGA